MAPNTVWFPRKRAAPSSAEQEPTRIGPSLTPTTWAAADAAALPKGQHQQQGDAQSKRYRSRPMTVHPLPPTKANSSQLSRTACLKLPSFQAPSVKFSWVMAPRRQSSTDLPKVTLVAGCRKSLSSSSRRCSRRCALGPLLERSATETPVSRQRSSREDRPQHGVGPGLIFLQA